jgi:hypothetical protein
MMPHSERNFYADHLVEINKTNPVITTQDICNSLGATVIPVGTNITEDVANKIAKFKLEIPIELQVNLAVRISPSELFNDISAIHTKIFGSANKLSTTKELIKQCGLLNAFPLVSQKLTVFEERMPVRYSDTQSVAGFAVLIAQKLGLSASAVEIIFATAQMHDAGFLNINPDTALNFESLSEDEKRALYKEQLMSGKDFLDQVPNLPKAVGLSVLAHQERKDGSGWPEGIIGDKNSFESQVVGLAVLLHESYSRNLSPKGYDCSYLIPVIEVQSESYNIDVYHAAVEMLRQGAHKTSQVIPFEFMPSLANYLIVLQRTLIHWFDLAKNCLKGMNSVPNTDIDVRSLRQVSGLEQLYNNSGIWEDGIRAWLFDIASSMRPEDCKEVELVAVMFDSIIQKLKLLQWSLRDKAKSLGDEWVERSDELAVLLYSLPSDHFDAFEKFDCFES